MQTNLKSQSDENVIMLNKPRTISERLAETAKSTFVGRKAELSLMSDAIVADELPFMVAFIHGPGGIGKSRLIRAALSDSGPEVRCCMMDCREIEPTPRGFQAALGTKLGLHEAESDFWAVVDLLNQSARRTVLALDTYESFGLMDTWLRQKFLPSLSDRVFTIIAGREAPNPAWLTTPGWQELFRDIKLGELTAVDAREMLESRGLTPTQADRIISFARGYPMVLEIAAAAIRGQPDIKIAEGPPPRVLQQLTNIFLSGMPQESMEAVEAASTVRRINEPMLRTLLAVSDVRIIFNNLQTLPFVNLANEGLIFHDIIREIVSKNLKRRDPERYQIYRKRAFSYLTRESHRTVARNLWQYTADLLYMIENPIARNAFFPEGASDYRVEPATADDTEDIRQIIMVKEPGESAHLFSRWLARHPETFSVAKNSTGRLEAFYFTFEPDKVDRGLLEEDPITVSWLQHLKENPLASDERVLFLPRWLDRETGEAPSPSMGACFLDIKRTYMELRPGLRRIYALVTDLAKLSPILFPLGFTALEKPETSLGGVTYYTIMNDFGPSSIDGWLAKLIGTELGVKSDDIHPSAQITKILSEKGRCLLTILFTDIVASTEKAVALGDARWRDLLDRQHDIVRRELARFQGREIDTAGDGFLATFTKPANAIRCATIVRDAIHKLGIQIRAGLHLGECEVNADAVRGVAVHIGARVAASAKTGEVLVSGTVKDAMAGSGIQFRNRGAQRLKGIPGEWPLFAIEQVPLDFQESSR